ncbi:MAG: helix-turn-helix domain-containing protein [Verrucomicrobiota bacterium JB024]|nr:helix-turn-helix domain-containing protein [Verrucomicrobiota bacterium JB024]
MSPTQKAVLISLADQANDQGVCWPSVGSIAERTCLSERAVRKAVRDLEAMGHVSSNGRSGTSSYYTVTPAPDAAPARDSAPAPRAPTPAPDAGEGGTSCRGPRHDVPPNRKEPSLNRQEPPESARDCPPNVSPKVWGDYVDHRKAKRAKLTDRAIELITKKLQGLSPPAADQCLELSIENGWTGVFPERVRSGTHENRSANCPAGGVAERIARANQPEHAGGRTFDG